MVERPRTGRRDRLGPRAVPRPRVTIPRAITRTRSAEQEEPPSGGVHVDARQRTKAGSVTIEDGPGAVFPRPDLRARGERGAHVAEQQKGLTGHRIEHEVVPGPRAGPNGGGARS